MPRKEQNLKEKYSPTYKLTLPKREFLFEIKEVAVDNPKEILNLFPMVGDVTIDKISQIGNSPQKDKTTPSPKVAENEKRFMDEDTSCGPEPRDHRGN